MMCDVMMCDAGKLFEEISTDTNRYCFGVEETLHALEIGAVETLIVWENLDVLRLQLRNTQSPDRILLFSIVVSHKHFTKIRTHTPTLKTTLCENRYRSVAIRNKNCEMHEIFQKEPRNELEHRGSLRVIILLSLS